MSGPAWVEGARSTVGGSEPARGAVRDRVASAAGPIDLPVRIDRLQIILWLVAGALISLNFLASVTGGLELLPWTITRIFDANDHDSILTGTQTTLLLASALLMVVCAAATRSRDALAARGWRALAAVTCFVFADESTSLHRSLALVLRDRAELHGLIRLAWALLYLPAAVVVLVVLLRHLRGIVRAVRIRLLPGVALYTSGAILFQPFVGQQARVHGDDSLSFKLMVAVAESVELVGLVLIFSAVLVAAARAADGYTVRLRDAEPTRRPVR
jgi:hypothetical protein